jgi:hypothetical protein
VSEAAPERGYYQRRVAALKEEVRLLRAELREVRALLQQGRDAEWAGGPPEPHVDVVRAHWLEGYAESLALCDPGEEGLPPTHGTYWWSTDPHPAEDCPFDDHAKVYLSQSAGNAYTDLGDDDGDPA